MSLEQVGQRLKAARESRGLSLRQVFERTKIPVGHLESIERGRGEDLPEPVYVAGFIRLYGDFVGLPGHDLAEEYRTEAEAELETSQREWNKQMSAPAIYSAPEYLNRPRVHADPPMFKTIYFNALMIVGVVALISYLTWTQVNNPASQTDPSLDQLRRAAAEFKGLPEEKSGDETSDSAGTGDDAGDARIALSANRHVWVDVKTLSTGDSVFSGFMEQGDRRDFQDPEGLRVKAGDGGSLTVDYRGKIETFGKPGASLERSFLASTPKARETAAAQPAPQGAGSAAVARRTPSPTGGGQAERPQVARQRTYRSVDEVQSRRYAPGESIGGPRRSIDVPYRFSEGRLDID